LNRVIRELQYELAGLDLGQIEHIIDESKQMLAVGLKVFEYAQHLLGWLAVSAVRHQFGIAQDGVERRAQLVAHIGKERGLVLCWLGISSCGLLWCISSNKRTFSIAMAAWSAKVCSKSMCCPENARGLLRVRPMTPMGRSSRSNGTPSTDL